MDKILNIMKMVTAKVVLIINLISLLVGIINFTMIKIKFILLIVIPILIATYKACSQKLKVILI